MIYQFFLKNIVTNIDIKYSENIQDFKRKQYLGRIPLGESEHNGDKTHLFV